MTYELNLKCIWQHPTTENHLEITKIVWREVEKPIIITVRSIRQAQSGETWISRDTFLPQMQTTTLKITLENGKDLSDTGLILPCALEKMGYETTSLHPYGYIWDYLDDCATSILWTEEVNMVKQGKIYYVFSWFGSSYKFVFEVKNNSADQCFWKQMEA